MELNPIDPAPIMSPSRTRADLQRQYPYYTYIYAFNTYMYTLPYTNLLPAQTFSANGDVAYATLRRQGEELTALLNPRRARHPLHCAFRSVN